MNDEEVWVKNRERERANEGRGDEDRGERG